MNCARCTRGDRPCPRRQVGSPAHAGIDRRSMRRASDPVRFPRTRGDRPVVMPRPGGYRLSPTGSPAHAGIDRPSRSAHSRRTGSPAHAGIDLFDRGGRRPHQRGSPAHAGIDPAVVRRWRVAVAGSPAHAGIDLDSDEFSCKVSNGGSPAHAGIDRPPARQVVGRAGDCAGIDPEEWVPPHTRG